MKNRMALWFSRGSWLLVLAVIAVSCNDAFSPDSHSVAKNRLSSQSNAELVMATQDVLDITGAGMTNQGINYGRAADEGENEDHLCGAVVTKDVEMIGAAPDSLVITGTITINFGDGTACGDSTENNRSGSIITEFTIHVNMKNHTYSSIEIVTLNEFTRGHNVFSGVFTARAASGGMRWFDIANARLTFFPHHDDNDGEGDDDDEMEEVDSVATTIAWSGSYTIRVNNGGTLTHDDDTKTVSGAITGTLNGESFSSVITNDILFKRACFHGRNIPVQGTIDITSGGTITTLDFGDGTCDKLYTSTSAGVSTDLHF